VQTHIKRPGLHPRPMLQEMVRLFLMPQWTERPLTQKDHLDGVRVQEMQESFPQGYAHVWRYAWYDVEADEYCPYCDNKYILDAVTKDDRWFNGLLYGSIFTSTYHLLNSAGR